MPLVALVIEEVLGSNPVPKTSHIDWALSSFPQLLKVNAEIEPLDRRSSFLPLSAWYMTYTVRRVVSNSVVFALLITYFSNQQEKGFLMPDTTIT
jgi:hypothetical protein